MSLELGHIALLILLMVAEQSHIWPVWHAGSQVSDRCPLGYLFTYIFYLLSFFLRYFLIKHEILFTNFARVEFECMFMSPATEGEGVHIALGADPVVVGIASCLYSITWPNRWISFSRSYQHFEIFKFWPKKACLHPISWTKWRILAKLHTL